QVREVTSDGQRPDNFVPQQFRVHHLYGTRKLDDEFVEKWAGKGPAHAADFFQLFERESRLGKILGREFLQALLAEQAEVNVHGQGAKRLIGADIRRGLLTADMLLARGEREHVTAPPATVHRFAREASGHLPHEFFARG